MLTAVGVLWWWRTSPTATRPTSQVSSPARASSLLHQLLFSSPAARPHRGGLHSGRPRRREGSRQLKPRPWLHPLRDQNMETAGQQMLKSNSINFCNPSTFFSDKTPQVLKFHSHAVTSMAFSRDDRFLLTLGTYTYPSAEKWLNVSP